MINEGKYEMIKKGYSANIVCSLNDEKCHNQSCQFFDEKWQGCCKDMLNCQPCPRSKLK